MKLHTPATSGEDQLLHGSFGLLVVEEIVADLPLPIFGVGGIIEDEFVARFRADIEAAEIKGRLNSTRAVRTVG